MEDKLNLLDRVVNLYFKNLDLYLRDNDEWIFSPFRYKFYYGGFTYRGNSVISSFSKSTSDKYNIDVSFNVKNTILSLMGIKSNGFYFTRKRVNEHYVTMAIKNVLMDKINKYFLEVNGYPPMTDENCSIEYTRVHLNAKMFDRKINLY